jgi:hypothetical protein
MQVAPHSVSVFGSLSADISFKYFLFTGCSGPFNSDILILFSQTIYIGYVSKSNINISTKFLHTTVCPSNEETGFLTKIA